MPKTGNKPLHQKWIRDHLDYPHQDCCLIWPFRTTNNGYGTFMRDGKKVYVHRYICESIHGPAPSDEYQAAHSCNRGHEGCVNPHHLRWKTRSDNQKEAVFSRFKLTIEAATEIRSLKGVQTARAIASRFGVRESTVRDIQAGRIWKPDGQRRRARVLIVTRG